MLLKPSKGSTLSVLIERVEAAYDKTKDPNDTLLWEVRSTLLRLYTQNKHLRNRVELFERQTGQAR
jgi:hypothetical protein